MSRPAWDLQIKLPDAWFMLPLGAAADLDDLEQQLEARIGREPELAPGRDELRSMLLRFAAGATERGAAGGAVRWARDELDAISTATLDTYLMDREPGSPGDALEHLRATVSRRQPTDRDDPVVELRRLPAGPALRLQVITETRPDQQPSTLAGPDEAAPSGVLLVETVQYWLPVPDHSDLVMLAFATPNLAGAQQLVAELDATVAALELVR